jgi:hypothetical protein
LNVICFSVPFSPITTLQGLVLARNAIGNVSFASIPDISVISGLTLNSRTGIVSLRQIFSTGDFGPFNFYVTDSLGNVGVSLPFYITIGDSSQGPLIITHFAQVYQCEIGTFCSIAQQACCGNLFDYNSFSGNPLPAGMSYTGDVTRVPSNTVMFKGIPAGPPGSFSQRIQMTYTTAFTVSNAYTVHVSPQIRIDPSYMQPSCDIGWQFTSHIRFTGGPQVDPVRLNPSVTVTILSGTLPPGVAIQMVTEIFFCFEFPESFVCQPLAAAGTYQFPEIVGSPTTAGVYTVTLKLVDYLGGFDTYTYKVAITAPPSLDVSGLPLSIQFGQYYSGFIRLVGVTANSPSYYLFQGGTGVGGLGGCMVLPPGLDLITSGQPIGTYAIRGYPIVTGNFTLNFVAQPYYFPLGNNGTATILGRTLVAPPLALQVAAVPPGSLPPGAIAGISIGAVVFACVIVVGTVGLYRLWNRSRINISNAKAPDQTEYYKF